MFCSYFPLDDLDALCRGECFLAALTKQGVERPLGARGSWKVPSEDGECSQVLCMSRGGLFVRRKSSSPPIPSWWLLTGRFTTALGSVQMTVEFGDQSCKCSLF